MSGFQVGDVVVCIPSRKEQLPPLGCDVPVVGQHYRVAAVGLGASGAGIGLEGMNPAPYLGYQPCRFRKIRPASDEFITALRACKPERVGEPA